MIAIAVIFGVMTLAVLAIVVLPLLRGGRAEAERGDFDRAVYRDQLAELDRDLARGLIVEREAQAARVEIQRRLLAADPPAPTAATAPRRRGSLRLAVAVAVLVAIGGTGLYLALGNPTVPDAPFAKRVAPSPAPEGTGAAAAAPHIDMAAAAQRLEEKLQADPSNRESWALYARTEAMLGNWKKASAGYQHAIDLGDKSADIYESFGEMQVLAAAGIVTPAARDAFVTAQFVNAKSEVARYYLALADSQAGESRKAISDWLALAADIPEDSQMRAEIARGVASAARSAGIDAPPLPKGAAAEAPPASASGPTPEQMAAAADMAPADREQMIRSMIAQLAARLQDNPNDADGWLRLGNAYAVQGQTDKAVDAFDHAAKLKPDDTGIKLQAVSSLLSRLQPSDTLPPRAVELLHEVAARAPETPEVLWYLGVVAARSGDAGEARQDWTRLLQALPKDGEDYKMVQAALAELKTP